MEDRGYLEAVVLPPSIAAGPLVGYTRMENVISLELNGSSPFGSRERGYRVSNHWLKKKLGLQEFRTWNAMHWTDACGLVRAAEFDGWSRQGSWIAASGLHP